MSVQLILYPQHYDGFYNYLSYSANPNYLVNFSAPAPGGNQYGTTAANPMLDAITNAPPSIINTMYAYSTTGSPWGNVAYPQNAGGGVYFSGYLVSPSFHTGVYQQMSGLVVGGSYTVALETPSTFTSGGNGALKIEIYSGTTLVAEDLTYLVDSPTDVFITFDFTCTDTNQIVLLDWNSGYSGTGQSLQVNLLKVVATGTGNTGIYNDLADGQVICDLYEDEDIPLTLSVDDFKNVAEKVQSYSKAFKLPATKRNNQIFDSIYEITRTDTGLNFNPYVKTQCVLKQDGFLLFEGYLRLIEINDKDGEISYNVNLYSEVVALKDFLENKSFGDISFVELEHTYNRTNIKDSWTGNGLTYLNSNTSGFRTGETVKYPFVDWTHQYTFDSNNFPVLPGIESTFRPWINIKYLIDRIFDESPFTYTSEFFETADFVRLFMDFNWGGDSNPNSIDTTGFGRITSGSGDYLSPSTWGNLPFYYEEFADEFGWDDGTDSFVCPAGQTNSTYNFFANLYTYSTRSSTLYTRFLYTPSGGTPVPISPSAPVATIGSAVIYWQADSTAGIGGGEIEYVTVEHGGYYSSAPTLTVTGGISAVLQANGSFPGPITSVTILFGGSGYDASSDALMINGENMHIGKNSNMWTQVTQVMNPGDTMEFQWYTVIAEASRVNTFNFLPPTGGGFNQVFGVNTGFKIDASLSVTGIMKNAVLHSLRGDLEQWEFLKGLMTMFNLVSMPDKDNPNNLIIEPYADVFINNTSSGTTSDLTLASRGIAHDWTDKIDVSEMKLKPLTDLKKETIFKFVEDDDDFAFNNYRNQVGGHLYGSLEWDATDFTVLTGEEEIEAKPFAATIPKPLMSQYADLIIPAIYSYNAEEGLSEGFENSPRILYNNHVQTLTSCTYHIPAQNDDTAEDATTFLQFTHLSNVPGSSAFTRDFNFGGCQYIGLGDTPLNNLFNTYWAPYYYELYDPDTRTMTIKVNLSPSDINTFNFFDTVMIKNREYRVNKIDYKPNDLATVEFILIT